MIFENPFTIALFLMATGIGLIHLGICYVVFRLLISLGNELKEVSEK